MSAVLLPAVLAGVLVGIVGGDATVPGTEPLLLLVAGLAAIALARPFGWRRLAVLGVLLIGAGIGSWRGAAAALPVGPGSVASLVGESSRPLTATVVDDPRPRGERQQVVVDQVIVGDTSGPPQPALGRILLWLPRSLAVAAGDELRFEARLEEPRDFDGFAYSEYLARQGIAATASVRQVTVLAHRLGPVPDTLRGTRGGLLSGLNRLIPEPEAALAAGILLGVRSGIDPAINDAFARAGLTHVVAISGWNIAIVAALAAAAARPLKRLPRGQWSAAAAAVGAVAAYVVLTGASPSVVRAALMAGGLLLARLGGSRSHAMSALVLAALAMVIAAPTVVWDVGFQLSALATAGLIGFGAGFEARLARWPAILREPVALTMAAQVATLPVILLNFERLSLVAPLANVLVVPLVPLVMLTAAVAALVGASHSALPLVGDVAAWASGGAAWLYLRLMVLAGQLAAAVPLASIDLGAPSWLAAVWYPGLLLFRHRLGGRTAAMPSVELPRHGLVTRVARPVPLLAATLATVAVLTFITRPDGRLHLVALDVGQGDAILVVAPSGQTALIDGGPDPDLTLRQLGAWLPFWQRRLDVMVLTHPHEDHVAGLVSALERFRVGVIYEPGREYENPTYPRFVGLARAEPAAELHLARAGDLIPLGEGARLLVLFPDAPDAQAPLPEGDINNSSVVLLLESGGFRALLTGDAEAPVEELLLERGLLGPVDVLKVGHHGSDSSTTPALLSAVMPQIALISCGTDNEYGHPKPITLEHLAAVPGLVVRRTDLEGNLELVADAAGLADGGQHTADTGSIGAWWFPVATRRCRSSIRWAFRTGSWFIRAALRESPPRRRAWWPRPASRWTSGSSRSPPCCTTSTSRGPAAARGFTARWPQRS
ncbi:MAG TPA: ComEC/Rec2 family competence protein [Candidatus Limnocylindria bacterium]|nr:ComEC/Rec2 family competence protein [Candidatus Limnocylindria bacterium]